MITNSFTAHFFTSPTNRCPQTDYFRPMPRPSLLIQALMHEPELEQPGLKRQETTLRKGPTASLSREKQHCTANQAGEWLCVEGRHLKSKSTHCFTLALPTPIQFNFICIALFTIQDCHMLHSFDKINSGVGGVGVSISFAYITF